MPSYSTVSVKYWQQSLALPAWHAHLAQTDDRPSVFTRQVDGMPFAHGYTPPVVPVWHSQSNGTTKPARSNRFKSPEPRPSTPRLSPSSRRRRMGSW